MEWSAQRFVLPPPVVALPGQSATGLHPFTPPGFAPPLSPFTPVTQPHPEPATQRDQLEPVQFCFAPPGQPDLLQHQQPPIDPAVVTLLSGGYSPGISTPHTDSVGASADAALQTGGAIRGSGDYDVAFQPVMEFAAA